MVVFCQTKPASEQLKAKGSNKSREEMTSMAMISVSC